ncbi:MAG: ABC transporter ATP-binding protein [Clostridiales bacterium]|nr:ABC transporter ATP-binding protein [Clostridiales bacterium]
MEILNRDTNQEIKLEIRNLCKTFDGKEVLKNISFDVKKGEFLGVLGLSGCGKTTLVRILIGLEKKDSGEILKDGKEISTLPPDKRGMGIIFQNYALFPNMTVLENVEYALKLRPETAKISREIALHTLDLIGMSSQLNKKPRHLSGGQQQRVAIARTLALNPDIILLDEPISALDVTNREIMKRELKEIQKKFNSTIIFITHEQEEAFYLSDRIMVMSEGKIEQLDTPEQIFTNPASSYINDFVIAHLEQKFQSLLHCTGRIKDEK